MMRPARKARFTSFPRRRFPTICGSFACSRRKAFSRFPAPASAAADTCGSHSPFRNSIFSDRSPVLNALYAKCANLSAMARDAFTAAERAVFRRLRTPEKIQYFLDHDIGYNKEPDGPTCFSPRKVLRERVAHCMEGALFGAAALRMIGFPALLLDFEAVRDDDHVLAL